MTSLAVQEKDIDLGLVEKVVIQGDLAALTPEERMSYYSQVCQSLSLNPLTQPFAYIKLNGKLTLYALKGCTDQLRRLNGISISKPDIQFEDGLCVVTVEARDKFGRTDSDLGVVALGQLQGEAKANAILKAISKAKRRVTLSICGLGMLDESEVETTQNAQVVPSNPPQKQIKASEFISHQEQLDLWKLAQEAGFTAETAKSFLQGYGVDSFKSIPKGHWHQQILSQLQDLVSGSGLDSYPANPIEDDLEF